VDVDGILHPPGFHSQLIEKAQSDSGSAADVEQLVRRLAAPNHANEIGSVVLTKILEIGFLISLIAGVFVMVGRPESATILRRWNELVVQHRILGTAELGYQESGREISRVIHGVDGGIEQVIADDEEAWVLLRLRLMALTQLLSWDTTRNSADTADPAMDATLDQKVPAVRERFWQCVEHMAGECFVIEV